MAKSYIHTSVFDELYGGNLPTAGNVNASSFNAFEEGCKADFKKLRNPVSDRIPDRLLNKASVSPTVAQNILSASYGVNSPIDALGVIQRLEDSLKAIQREQRREQLTSALEAPYQRYKEADIEKAVKTLYGLQNPAAVMPVTPKQQKLLLL